MTLQKSTRAMSCIGDRRQAFSNVPESGEAHRIDRNEMKRVSEVRGVLAPCLP